MYNTWKNKKLEAGDATDPKHIISRYKIRRGTSKNNNNINYLLYDAVSFVAFDGWMDGWIALLVDGQLRGLFPRKSGTVFNQPTNSAVTDYELWSIQSKKWNIHSVNRKNAFKVNRQNNYHGNHNYFRCRKPPMIVIVIILGLWRPTYNE